MCENSFWLSINNLPKLLLVVTVIDTSIPVQKIAMAAAFVRSNALST